MNATVRPIVQEITSAELTNSGVSASRGLSREALKKAESFVKAHRQSPHSSGGSSSTAATAAAVQQANSGAAQITSAEQALAVASRGRSDEFKDERKLKFVNLYLKLIASDKLFLRRDLDSLVDSLSGNSKSMADLRTPENADQRIFTKYLLTEIGLGKYKKGSNEYSQLKALKSTLLNEHSSLINEMMFLAEQGILHNLKPVQLRELVRAFRSIEAESDQSLGEVLTLLKQVKGHSNINSFIGELLKYRSVLETALEKENNYPISVQNKKRTYHLHSRINQINTLIKLRIIHGKFIDLCVKSKFLLVPTAVDLMGTLLSMLLNPQPFDSTNQLVKLASGVKGEIKNAKNNFITNYGRLVINHSLVSDMFRSNLQKQQIVDVLQKNVKSLGILAIGVSNE